MTEIGLFSADQIGLMEVEKWWTVTGAVTAKSLTSLGLIRHSGHTTSDGQPMVWLTPEGRVMWEKVHQRLPEDTQIIRVRDVEPGDHIQCWPHDTPSLITAVQHQQYARTIRLIADPAGWVLSEDAVVLLIRCRDTEPPTQMELF